jgi:hypothetical protein
MAGPQHIAYTLDIVGYEMKYMRQAWTDALSRQVRGHVTPQPEVSSTCT